MSENEELVWRNHGSGHVRSYTRNGRTVRGYDRGAGPRPASSGGSGGAGSAAPAGQVTIGQRRAAHVATRRQIDTSGTPGKGLPGRRQRNMQAKAARKNPSATVKGTPLEVAKGTKQATADLRRSSDQVLKSARRGKLTNYELDAYKADAIRYQQHMISLRAQLTPERWKAMSPAEQQALRAELQSYAKKTRQAALRAQWILDHEPELRQAASAGRRTRVETPRIFIGLEEEGHEGE